MSLCVCVMCDLWSRIYSSSVSSAWGVIPLHEKVSQSTVQGRTAVTPCKPNPDTRPEQGAIELRLLEKIECPTDAKWQVSAYASTNSHPDTFPHPHTILDRPSLRVRVGVRFRVCKTSHSSS